MPKNRLNLSLDQDLIDFAKAFAAQNRTSVAEVITQYLLSLKRQSEGETQAKILSHPAFHEAMKEVQQRLQKDNAQWQSFDDVFND